MTKMPLLFLKELDDRHLQPAGKSFDSVERGIGLAALDTTHVRPRKTTSVGKGFLRNLGRSSQRSHSISKSFSERNSHAPEFELMYTEWPRTNRDI